VGVDRFGGGLAYLVMVVLGASAVGGMVDFSESTYASSVGVLQLSSLHFAIGWSGSGTKCAFLGKWIENNGGRFSSCHAWPVSRSLRVIIYRILPAVLVGSILAHHLLSRKISLSVFMHGQCSASQVSMHSLRASSGILITGMVATDVR